MIEQSLISILEEVMQHLRDKQIIREESEFHSNWQCLLLQQDYTFIISKISSLSCGDGLLHNRQYFMPSYEYTFSHYPTSNQFALCCVKCNITQIFRMLFNSCTQIVSEHGNEIFIVFLLIVEIGILINGESSH